MIEDFSMLRQAFLDRKKVLKTSVPALSKYGICEGLQADENKENHEIVKRSRKLTIFNHPPPMVGEKKIRKKIKFDPKTLPPMNIIIILGVWEATPDPNASVLISMSN